MKSNRRLKACLAVTLLISHAASTSSRAQPGGSPEWLPGVGHAGSNTGFSDHTSWDPDGAGPMSIRMVFGGGSPNGFVADTAFSRFVTYDPATEAWAALDPFDQFPPPGSSKILLAGNEHGDLYASTGYISDGSTGVYEWRATGWQRIAQFAEATWPSVMALLPDRTLYATNISAADGVGAASGYLGRWDGVSWSGFSIPNGTIFSVFATTSGDLIVQGVFTEIDGTPVTNMARYDGTSWTQIAGSISSDRVLDEFPNGDLLVMRPHTNSSLKSYFRLAGDTLTLFGSVSISSLTSGAITTSLDSFVLYGSRLSIGQSQTYAAVRWAGSNFEPITPPDLAGYSYPGSNAISTMARLPNGHYFASGSFQWNDGEAVRSFARWDGTRWHRLRDGFDGMVEGITARPSGGVLVSGSFTTAMGTDANSVVQWNGNAWTAFSGTLIGTGRKAVELPNGDVYAFGRYPVQNFSSYSLSVAKRVSGQWQIESVPDIPGDFIRDADITPTGNLIICGWFSVPGNGSTHSSLNKLAIRRSSGWGWDGLGFDGTSWRAYAVAAMPNGAIAIGGNFVGSVAGLQNVNRVAWRSPAGVWSRMGDGMNAGQESGGISALVAMPNGDVVAGGGFTTAGTAQASNIARWNGTSWSPLGSGISDGTVYALEVASDGSVVAGGNFLTAGDIPANRIARWDGTSWSNFGSGIGTNLGFDTSYVNAIAFQDGEMLVGGNFLFAGGRVSAYFARWGVLNPTCNSIDFNNDTSLFDPQDISAFLSVYSEGPCVPLTATCNDIDFNNDTSLFDPCDISSFLTMYSEGPCTTCGH